MSRLIDADKVKEQVKLYFNKFARDGLKTEIIERAISDITEVVDDVPTVDTERHGHWNKEEDTLFRLCVYKCSLCGGEVLSEAYLFKYCPYCGCAIKMEVEE